ncbi:putative Zn-binding protein involved in type VI secretion [Xanthomonas translucens]|nr:putative Zn-binding protein involved in type VI secretion [Xanthomonas translucens]
MRAAGRAKLDAWPLRYRLRMQPAARLTDLHVCPMVTGVVPHVGGPILAPGAPTVLIGGLPAARIGDMAVCVGPPDSIVSGAPTVLIAGMPAARLGDSTAHGGAIVLGCFTVLIG